MAVHRWVGGRTDAGSRLHGERSLAGEELQIRDERTTLLPVDRRQACRVHRRISQLQAKTSAGCQKSRKGDGTLVAEADLACKSAPMDVSTLADSREELVRPHVTLRAFGEGSGGGGAVAHWWCGLGSALMSFAMR